jgi:chorismate synthase
MRRHGDAAGFGEPGFSCAEGIFSRYLFAVPAVKGVEFGAGFSLARMPGAEANDALYMEQDRGSTLTNHTGGINGGITNGMPVVFRAAVKPTPSIAKEQRTVDLSAMTDCKIRVAGRHDPCVVPRAVPAVEAAAALAALEILEGRGGTK